MADQRHPKVAIVDYGMGNLFSVQLACERAGARVEITSSPQVVDAADSVVLPGVGAFSDAMTALRESGMVDALRAAAESGKPLLGICLGLQLLMTESFEFGYHRGLGLIEGSVVPLERPVEAGGPHKVPHVGWNQMWAAHPSTWKGTPLEGIPNGAFMYFVHSYYVVPAAPTVVASVTRYGSTEFCSSLRRDNIFGCQFHPERSGPLGLEIYRNFAIEFLPVP